MRVGIVFLLFVAIAQLSLSSCFLQDDSFVSHMLDSLGSSLDADSIVRQSIQHHHRQLLAADVKINNLYIEDDYGNACFNKNGEMLVNCPWQGVLRVSVQGREQLTGVLEVALLDEDGYVTEAVTYQPTNSTDPAYSLVVKFNAANLDRDEYRYGSSQFKLRLYWNVAVQDDESDEYYFDASDLPAPFTEYSLPIVFNAFCTACVARSVTIYTGYTDPSLVDEDGEVPSRDPVDQETTNAKNTFAVGACLSGFDEFYWLVQPCTVGAPNDQFPFRKCSDHRCTQCFQDTNYFPIKDIQVDGYTTSTYQCSSSASICRDFQYSIPYQNASFQMPLDPGIIFAIIFGGGSLLALIIYFAWYRRFKPEIKSPELHGFDRKSDQTSVHDGSQTARFNQQIQPDEIKSGNPFRHFLRAFSTDFARMRPFEGELKLFPENHTIDRYLLYRRSALYVLTFFQIGVAVISGVWIFLFVIPRRDRQYERANEILKPAYYKLNIVLNAFDYARISMYVLGALILLYTCTRWRRFVYTSKAVTIVWAMQLIFPFILQLFPYKSLFNWSDLVADSVNSKLADRGIPVSFHIDQIRTMTTWSCKLKEEVALPFKKTKVLKCDDILDYIFIFWDALLGVKFGADSLLQLAPIGLGFLPGLAAGGLLVKTLLPWHNFPPLMTMFADVVYTPFVITLLVCIYQSVGDFVFLGFVLFIILKQVCFIPASLIMMQSYDQDSLQVTLARQMRMKMALILVAAAFLITWLAIKIYYFQALIDLDVAAAAFENNWLFILLLLFRSIANKFLTQLFISQLTLSLLAHMHILSKPLSWQLCMDALTNQLKEKELEYITQLKPHGITVVEHANGEGSPDAASTSAVSSSQVELMPVSTRPDDEPGAPRVVHFHVPDNKLESDEDASPAPPQHAPAGQGIAQKQDEKKPDEPKQDEQKDAASEQKEAASEQKDASSEQSPSTGSTDSANPPQQDQNNQPADKE